MHGDTLIVEANKSIMVFNLPDFATKGQAAQPKVQSLIGLEDDEFIRQVACNSTKAVITTQLEKLFELDLQSGVLTKVCQERVRSAVYNATNQFIIALIHLDNHD